MIMFQVPEHKTLGWIPSESPWLHLGKKSRVSHSEVKAETHIL